MSFSKEDWLQERFRNRVARAPGFSQWSQQHPIRSRVWLGFCRYADLAFESALCCWDVGEFNRHALAMSELASWLTNAKSPTETSIQSFRQYIEAGLTPEQAHELASCRQAKRRGRPITARSWVLETYEQRVLNPRLSWMQLAIKFCPCRNEHTVRCRERLRQQAIQLETMLTRLGV